MVDTTARLHAELQQEIRTLARARNAVIIAHNYERPEVQDVADFVGDSLGLSREAAKTKAEVIVFCGVHFMAETAAVLSPQKTVLLPDLAAGCSLAATINAEQLRDWKAEHPGAVVVSYVNTTAEVKAESDYCCTSGNAVEIVNSVPAEKEILFLPDMFLGAHVRRITGRTNMHVWMGECHVHAGIDPEDIRLQRAAHPGAEFLIHPECGCATSVVEAVSAGDMLLDAFSFARSRFAFARLTSFCASSTFFCRLETDGTAVAPEAAAGQSKMKSPAAVAGATFSTRAAR